MSFSGETCENRRQLDREDRRLDKHNSINLPPLQVNCCPARTLLINEAASGVSTPPCKQPRPIPQLPFKLLLHLPFASVHPLLSPSHLFTPYSSAAKTHNSPEAGSAVQSRHQSLRALIGLSQGQFSSRYYEKLGEPV